VRPEPRPGGTTFINPSFSEEDAEYQTLAHIHEVFHCHQAADFPSDDAFQSAPAWLIDGEAEWVAATLAPTGLRCGTRT
jgi:hypothetical protein